jgi:hypothetical protein
LCFNYSSAAATFDVARDTCAVMGGSLFMPAAAPKQLMVEAYFANSSTLTTLVYWLGIQRRNESYPFAFLDGTSMLQNVSNVPYAHWNWLYPNKRLYPYHCGVARAATSFDQYVGDSATLSNSDYFVTTAGNGDRK